MCILARAPAGPERERRGRRGYKALLEPTALRLHQRHMTPACAAKRAHKLARFIKLYGLPYLQLGTNFYKSWKVLLLGSKRVGPLTLWL